MLAIEVYFVSLPSENKWQFFLPNVKQLTISYLYGFNTLSLRFVIPREYCKISKTGNFDG